ncbi:MAG: metal-binding protein [Pirellulaceae bacterium]|nr:metal-binding protein [Pirellulaceae bacterium]
MQLDVAYRRRSAIVSAPSGLAIALAPNLRRDKVSFSGALADPLRFREAIGALHDVVISDLRYKPKDDTAYQAYLKEQQSREASLRATAYQAKKAELEAQKQIPMPPGLEADYRRLRQRYWNARQQYSDYIARHDPQMWRLLMPCDPVITVAPDVLLFECFSADESSYGCLSVGREAFRTEENVSLGTTNVDYSWSLYEHFQQLRSYRQTRFEIDPAGFEVRAQDAPTYREEKIDLPMGWLRGFMQLQAAMSLPMRKVTLSRESAYGVLAWLKRHKARKSPRALRFELSPGQPISLVLEPWEQRLILPASRYEGPRAETIRTWGRDRLRVLGRLLPLVDCVDVHLLGTGLPSFWIAKMGNMRLTLGLSGWTKNDWTGASALDQLAPPADVDNALLEKIARTFRATPLQSFEKIQQYTALPPASVAAGLNRLALLGQVIHDLPLGLFRWRQVMPGPLTPSQLGPENPETEAARRMVERGEAVIVRDEATPTGLRLLAGRLPGHDVELLVNGDGQIMRGKCKCSHHYKGGLRMGPCRHLQALRNQALGAKGRATSVDRWFSLYWK